MNNITQKYTIKYITGKDIPVDEVIPLFRGAFSDYEPLGIRFSIMSMSDEQVIDYLKKKESFVLYYNNEVISIVTYTLRQNKKNKIMSLGLVGTRKDYKGKGIGKILFDHVLTYAEKNNLSYILSDTSELSKNSNRWHEKCGFKKYGYTSFRSTNYFSIIYRLDLPYKSNNKEYTCRYIYYYIITKLSLRRDGTLTCFGTIKYFISSKIKSLLK